MKERGMSTLVLAPRLDDRFGVGKVTSRIGIESEATTFTNDSDLFALVSESNEESPPLVAATTTSGGKQPPLSG